MGGGGGGGKFGGTQGSGVKLRAETKSEALRAVKDLPNELVKTSKDFFRGGSNKYNGFRANQSPN